jgi:hypothetical protein
MRYFYLSFLSFLTFACQTPSSQSAKSSGELQEFYLKAEDVPKHIGEDIEIKVKIETTYFKEKENPYNTYLDVSKNYEENPFAIIIPFAIKDKFLQHQTYRGKTVIIRGRVETYDPWPYDHNAEKKPCIYLRTPDQLKIVK